MSVVNGWKKKREGGVETGSRRKEIAWVCCVVVLMCASCAAANQRALLWQEEWHFIASH